MYNQPFFIPNYSIPNIMSPARSISLFGRLNNFFKGFRSFNWTELINNTSKTLGIINQSIPIVKQVGPVFGNVKSMIKLASVFKDETDTHPILKQNNNQNEKESTVNNNINYESPTFFIN